MSTNASPTPSPPDLELERIRELLASRFGIVVSADDPILAAVALNEIVLDHHAQRVDRLLQEHTRRLAQADDTRLAKHRDLAKSLLGDALRQAKQDLQDHAMKLANSGGAGVRRAPTPTLPLWQTATLLSAIAALVGWTAYLITALR